MSSHKGGLVEDGATYTQNTLAEILGRTPDWIVDHIVDKGCHAKLIGNIYLISGQSFRIWCENTHEQATNKERRKRGRKSSVGGEAEG